MSKNDLPTTALPNIGPTIARRLGSVGVHTRGDLAALGAATIFKRVRERYPKETISLCYYLYSLDGALRGCHWDDLSARRKAALRREAGVE